MRRALALRAGNAQKVSITRFGPENSPLICIDDFFEDPEVLVDLACEAAFIDVGSRYPGVRAPVPQEYIDALVSSASPVIEHAFGAPPDEVLELCAFSMVTTAPEKLKPLQRIPHFDGPDLDRIAFIHYLCDARRGGTSFYRHRSTGLAVITPERAAEYGSAIMDELEADSPVHAYVIDHTKFFERLHGVEAAFNRLVIYPGNALHSGDISARTVLGEDPRAGRLTINGFGFLGKRNVGMAL